MTRRPRKSSFATNGARKPKTPYSRCAPYGAGKNIRKIFKSGSSYAVTIPLEIADDLKIRKEQKVVVRKSGERIIIEDWG